MLASTYKINTKKLACILTHITTGWKVNSMVGHLGLISESGPPGHWLVISNFSRCSTWWPQLIKLIPSSLHAYLPILQQVGNLTVWWDT